MSYVLPENLAELSAEEFSKTQADLKAHVKGLLSSDSATADELRAAKDARAAVAAEDARRVELAATLAELGEFASAPEPVVEVVPEPAPVTETKVEAPVAVVANRTAFDAPTESSSPTVVMTTASDVPGFGSGVPLESFRDAAKALDNRLGSYSSSTPGRERAPKTKTGTNSYLITPGRSAIRHGGVMFRREFPADLRITETNHANSVIQHAADETRLPGGSLLNSAKQMIEKQNRSLTAAVGWCAPSETLYDLCSQSSLDGLLDLPEVQATRGGFQVPSDGGPDFSVLWNGIGDAGDVILTEYDVENGAEKECFEIPCPGFTDVRLEAAYLCITGSLLQRRGYPEAVEFFSREAIKALAHKINASVIDKIQTGSGSVNTIAPIAGSDDAASALLSAVDLAIEDIKYRQRMSRDTTLEVVLPYWARVPLRAALARRRGVLALDVTDAELLNFFAIRNALPRFVYDFQDAYTGTAQGPGGASALLVLPATVDFLVYPAGTWTKIVRDVVNLDTIYDNAMLTNNQYTALFAEDGFNVIKTCPISRRYRATLDPSGVVGCCDTAS